MTSQDERQLIRLLAGELDGAARRELQGRLGSEDELRALYERLAATWEALGDGPPATVPPGFRAEVTAAARRISGGELSWALAPAWARAGAALALTVGLATGVGLGLSAAPAPAPPTDDEIAEYAAFDEPLSLAESYWLSLEDDGVQGAAAGEEPL